MSLSPQKKRQDRQRRHGRVRKKVTGTAERPRLAVFRSSRHISAQVIDDRAGHTLAAASTVEADLRSGGTGNIDAAKVAGETIGTNNLMVHSGSTPAFIAPPDGPARVYLDRIDKLRAQIDEIGLDVTGSMQRESGIALQMRFQALNGALARFAAQMEDLERRAWDLSQRWLGMTQAPRVSWPRDFNLADVEAELKILHDMQANGMPAEAVAAQQKRIVAVQFAGLDLDDQQEIIQAIDERLLRPQLPEGNVVPLQRPDPNAPLRDAVVRALGGADGR